MRAERPGVGSDSCHCWIRGTRRFGKASAVVAQGQRPSEQKGLTSEIFVTDTQATSRSLRQDTQTKNVKFWTGPVPAPPAQSPKTSGLDWVLWLAWLQGTKQISSDRDALSVTDCSPLHFCSLLLVSLVFQTFKIANLEHVGVFSFLY